MLRALLRFKKRHAFLTATLWLCCLVYSIAQEVSVTGTIISDEDDLPMIGVTVVVDGKENLGSISDVLSMARLGGRPGTGTYSIQDVTDSNNDDLLPNNFGITYLSDSTNLYASISGSVTITRSEENVVEGSFTVSLVSFDTNNPSTISITGEFVAIGFDFPVTGG